MVKTKINAGPSEHHQTLQFPRRPEIFLRGDRAHQGRIALQLFQGTEAYRRVIGFWNFSSSCVVPQPPSPQQDYAQVRIELFRDIKLENMIYNPKTRLIKLIDFGSALKFTESVAKKVVGTVNNDVYRLHISLQRSSTRTTTKCVMSGPWGSSFT